MSMSRGRQLIGKTLDAYVLEQLLGYGGSSAVFLARRQGSEQPVAIKVFLPRSTMNIQTQRDFYRRFLREAEATSKLHHPHILPITAYGSQDGLPYIIMPYMPGGTLREYVQRHGPLSLADAQRYLEQIAPALDHAHKQGFVHCDVKPANVLLDNDGNALLADFGIARLMAGEIAAQQELATGSQDKAENGATPAPAEKKPSEALMGTPDYISPEQALARPLDGRSDTYSLGVTLFYLLVGHVPFQADSSVTVALMHVHEPPPPLGLWRTDIAPDIDAVMKKALAKRPEDRFQSAGELSRAFVGAVRLSAQAGRIDPGSRPALREPSRKTSSNARQKVHMAQATVRVVPLHSRSRQFSVARLRPFIALAAVLALLLVGGTIFAYVSHGFGAPDTLVTMTPHTASPTDTLAERDDWPTGKDFFYKGQQYHIANMSSRYADLALFADNQYGNFHLAVTASELHGSQDGADYFGVVLRSSADQSHYYLLEVVAWGGGEFQFLRYDGDQHWKALAGGPITPFLTAIGASNTLSIDANGHTFRFWLNNQPIGLPVADASSSALSSGEIGLYVEEQGTEVAFSHLYITNP